VLVRRRPQDIEGPGRTVRGFRVSGGPV